MTDRILGDVHTHTLYSRHAYSTVGENVAAAQAAGLELLGVTDHFSSMLFPAQDLRNFQFFSNVAVWPRTWGGVTLLRGCEVDIIGLHGELFGQAVPAPCNIVGCPVPRSRTLFDWVSEGLDYLIASVHDASFAEGASLAQTTEMYLRVLEHPKVFILGHTGRSGVPYDLDEVLSCAKEHHKLIEINEHSLNGPGARRAAPRCREIAERCAELGVGISVSSDAHIAPSIGVYPEVTALLDEIHFPEELIVDRGRAPFVRELAAAGVCDLTDVVAA